MEISDIRQLRHWFLSNARDLPWRGNPSPYEVWVSEVMLQQTQVSVVIPYFLQWMERFPTIAHLANAKEEEVIKLWEGLGYYSRARNLHAGAKQIMAEFQGELPNCPEKLQTIKGLGPYTIGAVLNFAFKQKAPAVDGNVLRVLCRYYNIHDDITKTNTQKTIREKVLSILPENEPWVISEAFIELGAKVCNRTPDCPKCPLREGCEARKHGQAQELPRRKERPAVTVLHRPTGIIVCDQYVLLKPASKGAIMQGLYEFPFVEGSTEEVTPLLNWMKEQKLKQANNPVSLETVTHGFTRYQAFLYPYLIHVKEKNVIEDYVWVNIEELDSLPFSSGHRRIKCKIKTINYN